jgi:mono/diheme cytochrome c family protein
VVAAADSLKKIVTANDTNIAGIHALWALHGLGQLDEATHRSALAAKSPELRRNAIRALDSDAKAQALLFGSGTISDADPGTRLAAFVKLAQLPTTPEIATLASRLGTDPAVAKDDWLKEAVRILGLKHGVPEAGAAEAPVAVGDVKRGEEIFWKHPTAACALCHMLGGKGSTVGPAMDGIAKRKDAAYIKESLLEPGRVLAEGYQQLGASPMPPMGLILKPQELADIEAFLQTLK